MKTAFEGAASGVAGSGAAAFAGFGVGLLAVGGLAFAEADGADVLEDAGALSFRIGTGRTVAPDPAGALECAGT